MMNMDILNLNQKKTIIKVFYVDTVKIKFSKKKVQLEKITLHKDQESQKQNLISLAEKGRIPENTKVFNPRVTFDGESWWISIGGEVPTQQLNR